jgi:hypothetical protein
MLRRVAVVRTDVSEELSASIILFLRSVRRLLVTANVVPSSPILVTLMMEALRSPKRRFLLEPHGVTSRKTPFFTWMQFSCRKFENKRVIMILGRDRSVRSGTLLVHVRS